RAERQRRYRQRCAGAERAAEARRPPYGRAEVAVLDVRGRGGEDDRSAGEQRRPLDGGLDGDDGTHVGRPDHHAARRLGREPAGGVGFTVKLTLAVPVAPSESRAAAVRTCTPSWRRTTVRVAPAPRSPSRLDDQRMPALGSGSKSSVAVAARVTGVPANADPSL